MKYNCLKCALIAIYKAWTTIYILFVFHSSGESVLNKNYKINKSLNFNTVLCVSAYRDSTVQLNLTDNLHHLNRPS